MTAEQWIPAQAQQVALHEGDLLEHTQPVSAGHEEKVPAWLEVHLQVGGASKG
jgi:hypothetical protein